MAMISTSIAGSRGCDARFVCQLKPRRWKGPAVAVHSLVPRADRAQRRDTSKRFSRRCARPGPTDGAKVRIARIAGGLARASPPINSQVYRGFAGALVLDSVAGISTTVAVPISTVPSGVAFFVMSSGSLMSFPKYGPAATMSVGSVWSCETP